jgi:superoxide dismutase, Cu-Zn family
MGSCNIEHASKGLLMNISKLLPILAFPLIAAHSPMQREAHFMDAQGKVIGKVHLMAHGDMPMLTLNVRGLTPGAHGLHIHPIGKCNLPDFSEAGKHWNPLGHQHGKNNPQGSHMGDLPNLVVNAKGRGKASLMLDGISMTGPNALVDVDGFAVIIHVNADDYTADPSGNSGTKIACAAFSPSTDGGMR